MARRCQLSGIGVQTGNNVSHAKNRSRRRFLPNLCNVNLLSNILKESISLRISAHTLRSVEHCGGLDEYLIKSINTNLSPRALRIKKRIKKNKINTKNN